MQNKGLPAGSNQWARDIEEGLAKLKEIEAIARRMCADFGLDFSNPSRGLNTGFVPSIQNPVQLKLPSLQDLDIRDAQDGDLLTFDGKRGVWVARRHNTVQQPKTFPLGDPASYYTAPVEPEPSNGVYAENLFPNPELRTLAAGLPKGLVLTNYGMTTETIALGDGTNALRMTSVEYDGQSFMEFDATVAGLFLPANAYIISFDLTVPTPFPEFYSYQPIHTNQSGDNVRLPIESLTSGIRRVHAYIPPEQTFDFSLNVSLDAGHVQWSNFQITQVPAGHRRVTASWFPNTETIDVTSTCLPGKKYFVHDGIDDQGTHSFSIEATTPAGSTVLFSRNQDGWPQAIVTIPEDATSVSYTITKATTGIWHNVNIAEAPPEFFEGSMADDTDHTYSWASTADDSMSIRTPK